MHRAGVCTPTSGSPAPAYDELTNVLRSRWSARASVLTAIVLGRNEVAIPAQKRIGGDYGGNLGQRFSTQTLGLDGEPAALIVREPESFAPKLCSEHTVLFSDVVDHGLLIAVDPTSQAEQQELEMVRHHGYEDITLGADDCTAHGRATVARTEAKLLILRGISGGRVLAQDGLSFADRDKVNIRYRYGNPSQRRDLGYRDIARNSGKGVLIRRRY